MAAEVAFECLQSRYADDDDSDVAEDTHTALPAVQQSSIMQCAPKDSSVQVENVTEQVGEVNEDYEWEDIDEEDFDSDDGDLYAALEWADDREGPLPARCELQHQDPC